MAVEGWRCHVWYRFADCLGQWLRQCCTREFIDEQYNAISSMSVALQVTRKLHGGSEVNWIQGLKAIARNITHLKLIETTCRPKVTELAKVRLERLFVEAKPIQAFLQFFTDQDDDEKFWAASKCRYWQWVAKRHKPQELTSWLTM